MQMFFGENACKGVSHLTATITIELTIGKNRSTETCSMHKYIFQNTYP